MIDRTHALPVARQCQLLKLPRSTASYQPKPVSDTALTLMRRIDELHLQYPFAGARMLRDLLGDTSRNGILRTRSTGVPRTGCSKGAEVPFRDSLVDAPEVIAGEADMLPAER